VLRLRKEWLERGRSREDGRGWFRHRSTWASDQPRNGHNSVFESRSLGKKGSRGKGWAATGRGSRSARRNSEKRPEPPDCTQVSVKKKMRHLGATTRECSKSKRTQKGPHSLLSEEEISRRRANRKRGSKPEKREEESRRCHRSRNFPNGGRALRANP